MNGSKCIMRFVLSARTRRSCSDQVCILKYILLVLGLIFMHVPSIAQSKKELERKRKQLNTEIASIDKELTRTAKSKQAALEHYEALRVQIRKREELIQTIQTEMRELDAIVERNTQVVISLSRDMQVREEEYGRMMRSALRFKMMSNPFLFILSAESINHAYKRWVFLRKYDKYRRMQSEAIKFTRAMLTRKILQIEESKLEKSQLIDQATVNKSAIATEMAQENTSLMNLKSDEQRLKKDLEEKKKAAIALDAAIERIIRDEVAKAAEARAERDRRARERIERAKAEAEAAKAGKPERTEVKRSKREQREAENDAAVTADDAISKAFIEQKGRHAWPVQSGFIARPFGNVSHPVYKEITIQNNGIDIRTDVDATVSAIYSGEVVGVTFVPGHDYTVIVQHGNFYSVYANLVEASVSKGDQIEKGSRVGRVSMNPISGAAELHLELWLHKERLDPERWIGR